MTDEEAAKLQSGDRVWITGQMGSQPKKALAVVVSVRLLTDPYIVAGRKVEIKARRLGKNSQGNRNPCSSRPTKWVELAEKYDPTTANVFADFLEEYGHLDAAELLRKHFPIGVT